MSGHHTHQSKSAGSEVMYEANVVVVVLQEAEIWSAIK